MLVDLVFLLQALSLQDFQMAIKYYSMGLSHDVDKELHPVILSNRSPAYAHTGRNVSLQQNFDPRACPVTFFGDNRAMGFGTA